jgi:aminopeptidase N
MNRLFPVLIFCSFTLFGQKADVLHYDLDITVNDENNVIEVHETVTVNLPPNADALVLNLEASNGTGGMAVVSVTQAGSPLVYKHKGDQLIIRPLRETSGEVSFELSYSGIPNDGLVIGKNKFGDRTFFGDNWPNRARQWFACVDHPSDKATVRYVVHAPAHYTCVANGKLISEETKENTKTTVYATDYPLPTKVMVIGLADLVKDELQPVNQIPVTSYVYPQNQKAGFKDMAMATEPLQFFSDYVAAYPYEKLFNVQSTTRFGGMENAGCIFYDENAVTGNRSMDNLIAHEIAHQWFGNSASETDWSHLWLSEGFATYFTSLYIEHAKGKSAMQEQLRKDRQRVIDFSKTNKTPVVDTLSTDLMYLLNPNSYQKGCWFLHMLRMQIGDEKFQQGVRNYYAKYAFKNASTDDFRREMEAVSGSELGPFFTQWLRQYGQPQLKITKVKKGKYEMLQIVQLQDTLFSFPLEVLMKYEGEEVLDQITVSERETILPIPIGKKLIDFDVDPHVKLLFELSPEE